MQHRKIRAALIVASLTLGGLGIAAAPAMACTGTCSNGNTGVTATANVGETISLTGLSPSVSFGTLTAGQQAVALNAEAETVSTNDPAGYTLSVIPGAAALLNGGSSIPNSDLQIMMNSGVASPGTTFTFSGSNPLQTDSETGAITDTYSETWKLNAPNPLPSAAGNYSESFTYLALAS